MRLNDSTYRLRRDDMSFLVFIEMRDTLDGHVIGFSSTRSEDDIFGLCADEIRYVL
jgi:hypothetical protein